MKILDEKGRVFGKINLVDLVVILVVIAVIISACWKVAAPKITEIVISTNPTYEYTVLCRVFSEVAECAKTCVGEQLMASGKLLDGEIINVEARPHVERFENGELMEDPNALNLYITIRCRATQNSNIISIGTQELRVGKTHIVKTTHLEMAGGIILSMREVTPDE